MMPDRYRYIRERYGVPIFHRCRVAVDGMAGAVEDVWGTKVMVMIDGESWARLYEPDDLDYMAASSTAADPMEVPCGA